MPPMPAYSLPTELDEPTLSESDGVRYLHFNTAWIQGAMVVRAPTDLVLEYTAQMMAWLLFLAPPKGNDAIGLLGLGAGSLARFCLKRTRSHVLAVEWNPRVTSACQMFFKLPPQARLDVEHMDAAAWVADPLNRGRTPILMVDLYDAQARGPVRDSVAFYRDCRRALGDVGVMTVNLFGDHDSFPRNIDHIERAFDKRVVLLPEIDAGNRIALAFTGPPIAIEAETLMARAEEVEAQFGLPARRWGRALMAYAKDGVFSV